MQSTTFSFSLTLPSSSSSSSSSLKRPLSFTNPNTPNRFNSLRFDPIRAAADNAAESSFPRRSWSSSLTSKLRPWTSLPVDKLQGFMVQATAVLESASEDDDKSSNLKKTLLLGLLFGQWYLFDIYFNIYNKQMPTLWVVGSLLPIVGGVALASVTEISSKVMELFIFVVLLTIYLREMPTLWVLGSLLRTVGEMALASVTETSFNWSGILSAMASNVTNQSRNVLSKKVMLKKEDAMDNITLFSILTVMSFFLLVPVTIFMEGVKFTPAYLQSTGVNVQQLYIRSLVAALCFHAYQQVSYMILARVSPVTHSVGNCVKRVVVIVRCVIFFKTPVSPINALGTGIALSGVFLYSIVKRIKAKPKTA